MVKRRTLTGRKNKPVKKGPQLLKHKGSLAEQDAARSEEEAAQGNLPGTEEAQVERSPVVQHGRMSAHFVRFVPDRTKTRERIVFMDFSLELEEAHEGRIPREIEDEWKHFRQGSVKRTDPSGMGTQNLDLAQTSDGDVDLSVTASLPRAVISRITQKGKGKERKVIRLQLRFLTGLTADVERFCRNNYDETVWLVMRETQRSLGEAATGEESVF